jgi:hypothetical protein
MKKRLAYWAGAVAATGVIAVALAGCGTKPASPVRASIALPSGKSVPSLCRKPADALQARVTQFGAQPARVMPGGQPSWPGPSGVVTGPAARSLARALCSLPLMPSGAFQCPAMLFEVYQVVFLASGGELFRITVQATGCRQVTGLGRARWAVHNDALLEKLARIATGTQHFGPVRDSS